MVSRPRTIVSVSSIALLAAVVASCAAAPDSGDLPPAVQCNLRADTTPTGTDVAETHSALADQSMALVPIHPNTVNVIDASIRNKLLPVQVWEGPSPTGSLSLDLRIANCTDFPIQIEGRTQFFDIDMRPSEPVSAWDRLYLAPRSLSSYRINGVSPISSRYLIDLREGD